jgi:hypothetical protein
MLLRRLFPYLPVLLLAGCSQATTVSARFIDGRLAFVPINNDIGCIHDVVVIERATRRVMWKVPYVFEPPTCTGGVPLIYGSLPDRASEVTAQGLKSGFKYEITGTAAGGNYFGGVFIIEKIKGYRVRDTSDEHGIKLDMSLSQMRTIRNKTN